jgi:hypothetical protein
VKARSKITQPVVSVIMDDPTINSLASYYPTRAASYYYCLAAAAWLLLVQDER